MSSTTSAPASRLERLSCNSSDGSPAAPFALSIPSGTRFGDDAAPQAGPS